MLSDDDLPQPPDAMCATCKAKLIVFMGEDREVTYYHALRVDHETRPVPSTDEQTYICDFCTSPAPSATQRWFMCAPFATPEYQDDGEWAACDVCAGFIRAGRWEALTGRMKTLAALRGWPLEVLDSALALQAEFRRHYIDEVSL